MNSRIFIVFAFCMAASCGNVNTGAGATPLRPETAEPQPVSASVLISSEGKTLVNYECRNPNAVLDADILLIELNSTDARFSLLGNIGSTRSGDYPMTENQQKGKASITLYCNDSAGSSFPPGLTPADGILQLKAMNGKTCSGAFSGTVKDLKGRSYTIAGQFSNIPVREIGQGK